MTSIYDVIDTYYLIICPQKKKTYDSFNMILETTPMEFLLDL